MYTKNANVFAAIPSLHAAFPTILLIYGLKKGLKYAAIPFFVIMIGIWFAAIYTYHHYIIDVLLGASLSRFVEASSPRISIKSLAAGNCLRGQSKITGWRRCINMVAIPKLAALVPKWAVPMKVAIAIKVIPETIVWSSIGMKLIIAPHWSHISGIEPTVISLGGIEPATTINAWRHT